MEWNKSEVGLVSRGCIYMFIGFLNRIDTRVLNVRKNKADQFNVQFNKVPSLITI